VIIEEVDRLNRVVTQFLDYSKPPTTDLQPVDLSELARKTVEKALPSLNLEKVQLEFVASSHRAAIQAAPEQIQQVLLYLIQNSVKALEGRTDGRITLSVQIDDGATGGEVSATVLDNGKGIKKEHLDKLFIPFFTTSPQGTGLGLSISHKIVEAHRGRIEIATEEGRFARFSVILPRLKE
jgi:two-component system sensor histidine kinase HydH